MGTEKDESVEAQYDLFISYSTKPDYALSRKVESFLESFHRLKTPEGIKLKPLSVCRDGSDFSLHSISKDKPESSQQNAQIQTVLADYLQQSRYLLVLCSRNSAISEYVRFEIEWFIQNKGLGAVLLGVTEGENVREQATEIFSPALIQHKLHSKIFYDFRGFKNESKHWQKVRDYEEELTNLAAHLNGQTSGKILPLWQREEAKKRKKRLFITGVALAVLIIMGLLFGYSYFQRRSESRDRIALHLWDQSQAAQTKKNNTSALLYTAEALEWNDNVDRAKNMLLEVQPLALQSSLHTILSDDKPIINFIFSSEGQKFLTASESGTVRLWDLQSGKTVGSPLPCGLAKEFCFSPDQQKLLVILKEKGMQLWDLPSGRQLAQALEKAPAIQGAHFHPQGHEFVTTANDGVVRFYNTETGAATDSLLYSKKIIEAFYSPDGQTLFIVDNALKLRFLDGVSKRERKEFMQLKTLSIYFNFSRDGKKFLVADTRNSARLMDVASLKTLLILNCSNSIGTANISPDGNAIITNDYNGTIRLWDATSGQEKTSPIVTDPISWEGFTPDGHFLKTKSINGNFRLWDIASGAALGPSIRIVDLISGSFSPDGQYIATNNGDGVIRVWKWGLQLPLVRRMPHENEVASLSFSPDGERLLTTESGVSRFWNASSGTLLDSLEEDDEPHEHEDTSIIFGINKAVYSPDGQQVLAATGDGIRFWDAATGRVQKFAPIVRDRENILFACYSPDGKLIASFNESDSVSIWNGVSSYSLKHRNRISLAAYSRDGKHMLTVDDSTVYFWDLETHREVYHNQHADRIIQADATPDRRQILTVTADGKLRLWDTEVQQLVLPAFDVSGAVYHAAFSPNGKHIITVGDDSTACLWDVKTRRRIGLPQPLYGAGIYTIFSMDGRFIAVISRKEEGKETVNVWNTGGDWDIPSNLFKLQAQVMTGMSLDAVKDKFDWIPASQWQVMKQEYETKIRQHYKQCKYPTQNVWAQFHSKEAATIRP